MHIVGHVLEERPGIVVHSPAVGKAIAQTQDRFERQALRDVPAHEIEFLATYEVDLLAAAGEP
jgi:hypothetical protein